MPENEKPQRSLVRKIAEVMKAVGGVPKKGYNSFHKYAYATEADILDAVRDELATRHCILVPSVESYEIRDVKTQKGEDRLTTILMNFTAMDGESGESFKFGMLGQGQDPGDKGAYKAETGAEKYAIKKLFLLGDHEADPEADTKTDEAHAKAKKPTPSKPDARGETPAKPTEREVAVTTGEATPRWSDLGEPLTPGAKLEVKMNEAQSAEDLTRIAAGLADLAKTENIPAAELKTLRSVYATRMNALLIRAGK